VKNLESKRQEFRKRLDELSKSQLESIDGMDYSDLEGRIQSWEAELDRRLTEHRRAQAPEPHSPIFELKPEQPLQPVLDNGRPFPRLDATLERWLTDLDHMMLGELALRQIPRPKGFERPIQIFENDQSMRQSIAKACDYPGDPAGLRLPAHGVGAFHAPGLGTFLNKEHYITQHGFKDFQGEGLQAYASLISEIASERWGWGYLLEYTALGQAAGNAGLWPSLSAARLEVPATTKQQYDLAKALRQSWCLSEVGWMDWVWQYVMFKSRHPIGEGLFYRPRPGRMMELVVKIIDLFPLYLVPYGVKLRLRNLLDLVNFLFLEEGDILPRSLNSILVWLQKQCTEHDEEVEKRIGQSLRKIFGRFYFAKLEGNVGILATPYAVLVAWHLPGLDLRHLKDGTHLLSKIESEPRLNPDTRLAMLSGLDPRVKYDPRAMFIAAWERLKLEGPSGVLP
jgi:hypothetical protein